jgi:hypothetical protein
MEDLAAAPPIRVLATGARADGPESRGLAERCLVGFNSGPPMVPSGYNNHLQLHGQDSQLQSERRNRGGLSATLTLIERFRRTDATTLHYEFTVEDPPTFTRPFTALVPMQKSDQPVFEYACHEGNYGLASILRGARAEEAQEGQR